MEKLLEVLLSNPEMIGAMAKEYIDKYKPAVYSVCSELFEVYKDFAQNQEYKKTVAQAKKDMYDAYVEVGFSGDQAISFIINDNLKLMESIKNVSNSTSNNRSSKSSK